MNGRLYVQLLLFLSPRTPAVAKVCRIPASSSLQVMYSFTLNLLLTVIIMMLFKQNVRCTIVNFTKLLLTLSPLIWVLNHSV